MTKIDLDKLRALNETLYTTAARNAFGDNGLQVLARLVSSVVQIYRRLDPGSRTAPLVLFADVSASPTSLSGMPQLVHRISNLGNEIDGACMARVNGDTSLQVYPFDASVLMAMSRTAVVYRHHQGVESFVINGNEYQLINPITGYGSVFCRPTFGTLADALDEYRTKSAAHSGCEVLKTAWHEPSRWFLKTKPEQIMRKSLVQYLSNVLDDAEVRPEQNVDESHPVDIKVSFALTDLRAIIEIKWLGNSVDETGKMTTHYTQARAQAGAQQLAEYLDSSHEWGSGVKTRGYLVVFDARRKGLSEGIRTLSHSDAMHFKDEHITYSPDHSAIRNDFAPPVRMYMFPKQATTSAPSP
ncbi:hypothetical protein [Hylemonella gracilis]|uniref:Uncharacterized protein n=1 Tax=Hylemonella gracilis ATCC 19624 TaxID=887062 RepID=F3KSN9_9BURK|nr:hypothetical protein [Hylemonella gracilis]EGI77108.1 hypothetical protein HGR_07341 [Hylemonella gracilis ATCC 19624]